MNPAPASKEWRLRPDQRDFEKEIRGHLTLSITW
jgi:hypothetical protein